MLEVDEDSRLGREVLAGGTRYHAALVPNDDAIARMYERAIERLDESGISNTRFQISAGRVSSRGTTCATGNEGPIWAWGWMRLRCSVRRAICIRARPGNPRCGSRAETEIQSSGGFSPCQQLGSTHNYDRHFSEFLAGRNDRDPVALCREAARGGVVSWTAHERRSGCECAGAEFGGEMVEPAMKPLSSWQRI